MSYLPADVVYVKITKLDDIKLNTWDPMWGMPQRQKYWIEGFDASKVKIFGQITSDKNKIEAAAKKETLCVE